MERTRAMIARCAKEVRRFGTFKEEVQAAIERHIWKLAGASIRNVHVLSDGNRCPVCDCKVICVYDDLGDEEYRHNFAHICLNPVCDYHIEREHIAHKGIALKSITCVFCGRLIDLNH